MRKIAILISGNGTNMENLVRECHNGRIPAEAALVISDTPAAKGLEKARNQGVPAVLVNRKLSKDKASFEAEINRLLVESEIDLVALAGFMRILSSDFVRRWWGKLINIHPSLLPAFPGADGIRDAFKAHVKETGVTVHFVDEGVDSGGMILQKKVAVVPGETLETLEAKIHAVEYEIYPEALRLVLAGKAKPK